MKYQCGELGTSDRLWPNGYFPIKVQYMDTEEICICNTQDDIQSSRAFKVLQLNVGENRNG